MEPRASNAAESARRFPVPAAAPSEFSANKIRTSKYTYLTFLPKNLYEQFHRVANVYFLLIAVLQATPAITVSNGIPSMLMPLLFVLTISAVKDFLEDFKRRESDTEENSKIVHILRHSHWADIKWQHLRVGDVVQVHENEYFPADLILLASSEGKGICYVETKNLDGETNLKHKLALKGLHSVYQTEEQLEDLAAVVTCDAPNSKIYSFQGRISMGEKDYPLDHSQLLLRGSSLRNTKWIIGIVVYSGHDTKLMQNSAEVRFKYSHMENQMSAQIIYVILLQISLCLLCATYYTLWYHLTKNDTDVFLDLDSKHDNLLAQFIITFFSWMLIFTNFVPISLIVTLEVVKFLQAFFFTWDLLMYHEATDTPASVQSSSLNEELGQISHIFTDKTGTLTCNVMEFRKFSLSGRAFGTSKHMDASSKVSSVDFCDPSLSPSSELRAFMWVLATCHTVIAEKDEAGEVTYKAASPDELALVQAAKFFGVRFLARSEDNVIAIDNGGVEERIQLLNVLEFTSERKRMSVILRTASGRIVLLCKGADSALTQRLASKEYLKETETHLESFASEGLRTLMVTEREWSESEYEDWNARWNEALLSIGDREKLKDELADEAEQSLRLLGATAIEDKLQDGVAFTVSCLRKAGIKVWMLTGDKTETAINIGYACTMLSPHMPHIALTGKTRRSIQQQLAQAKEALRTEMMEPCALIVSGEALESLPSDYHSEFVKIAEKCQSVLCCRVTPQQKAFLVTLMMKHNSEICTLAIGDGANDVNMITTAHVGVGIAGLEGTQAVRASDFSLAQFRFLQRLLFVHGHECYRRNAAIICYNFYKNMLLVMPLFWYGTISAFSGNLLYNMWGYGMYNMFFSAFPITVFAIFDHEMDLQLLHDNPKFYRVGLKKELFTTRIFWLSIVEAAILSLVICFGTFYCICLHTGDSSDGKDSNIWTGAMAMYSIVVIVVNLKIVRYSYSITALLVTSVALGPGLFVLVHFILLEWLPKSIWLDNWDMGGAISVLLTNVNFYNTALLIGTICFMFFPLLSTAAELIAVFRSEEKESESSESDDDSPLLEVQDRYSRYTGIIRHKHTGFAFSQEAGHTPQITDSLRRRD